MKFLIAALLTLCHTMQAFETHIIDQQSENKMQVIDDVLDLQKTLVADLTVSDLPQNFIENGFLTRRLDPDHLTQLFEYPNGKIIAAYEDAHLVGYLLIHDPKLYYDWAIGREFDSSYTFESLVSHFQSQNVLFLDQIAVSTTHARLGIGSTMMDVAKTLAPNGLFTSILYKPFVNQASLTFFTKQKFSNLGIMDIDDSPDGVFKRIFFMAWNPHE